MNNATISHLQEKAALWAIRAEQYRDAYTSAKSEGFDDRLAYLGWKTAAHQVKFFSEYVIKGLTQ